MNNFCDCEADGWCDRYKRVMAGRFRELCAGVDVDLGTAAAFRAQFAADSQRSASGGDVRPVRAVEPTKVVLYVNKAPGDAVASTGAIYSLHRAHPGRYLTAVETPYPEVFDNNPDVSPTPDRSSRGGWSALELHYPAINDSNRRGIHFMQGICEHLGASLGVSVPLATERPRLYFRDPDPPSGDYWVVCSGGKDDFTAKLWGHERYREVVSRLRGVVTFVQVGVRDHIHQPLSGTENLIGNTTLRRLFDVVRRARGVLCGVSLLMHVAAALRKPCVVVAGGREPVAWNAYPTQQYLHTVGALPCTSTQGEAGVACWRSRVWSLEDGNKSDLELCQRPCGEVPECMALITPAEVVAQILKYDRRYGYLWNSPRA